MTLKQKLVMIATFVLVWAILIVNLLFKPSVPQLIIQLMVLSVAQIFCMKVLKKKPDSTQDTTRIQGGEDERHADTGTRG